MSAHLTQLPSVAQAMFAIPAVLRVFIGEIIMTIKNALASVAVKDIDAAVRWYAKVLARPADSTPLPELAEWKFPGGGGLQVYALPERAGSCSCILYLDRF